MTSPSTLCRALALFVLLALNLAHAQEATIRKNLGERMPRFPEIVEIAKTPMPGLFEVRTSNDELFYTDAEANFLLQGVLVDTQSRVNLTEMRLNEISGVAFSAMPLKDAITIVRGKGTRKLVVFDDPNCPYCKRLERDLAKLDDVTIHVFLYPVLGQDSIDKSNHIWCAKDRQKAFSEWMLGGRVPPKATCDTAAISRNLTFGQKYRIRGTPTMFLTDGTRLPGYVAGNELDKMLNDRVN